MNSMKKMSIIAAVIALFSASCGKSYLTSLQNNPNSPTTSAATPQLVLPGTLTSLVKIMQGYGTNSSYEAQGVWLGDWNYSPGYSFVSTVQNYVMTSSDPQLWDNYYGTLANLDFIKQETATDPKMVDYNAIADVLEVLCFHNLVDLYGDIPFSEALKAQKNFYPNYDKGSDVYDSLVLRLDKDMAAIQNAGANATAPTNDDIMFGGNMHSWLLYANTLKLRLLVHQAAVSSKASFLQTEAGNTASIGYMTTDALVNPGYSGGQPSQMWGGFGLTASGAIAGQFTFLKGNQVAIDFYTKTQDSRLGYIYSANSVAPNQPEYFNVSLPIKFSNYSANYTGTQASLPNGGSGIGSGLVSSPNQSAVMMTGAESYFLQAEATVRGWLNGGSLTTAQTLYQSGITSSYEYLNVGGSAGSADAAALAYYSQNVGWVAFPTSASPDSLIHTIIEQRWAALNGITFSEIYTDWRRTFDPSMGSGYPIVPLSNSPSNTAPHMPFRYLYPTEESNNNNASWVKAGGPSVDPFNTKIFWMP
jgi:hypothetical protein